MSKNNLYNMLEFGNLPIEKVLHTKHSRNETKDKMVALLKARVIIKLVQH